MSTAKHTPISFEFFPPKTPEGAAKLVHGPTWQHPLVSWVGKIQN